MIEMLIIIGYIALITWLIGAFEGTSASATMRRALVLRAKRKGDSDA